MSSLAAKQKYFFYPPLKRWVVIRNSSRNRRSPSMASAAKESSLSEYITFDVVDMLYPYNAIFGWGLLNTFEAMLHSAYLYLKVPATFRVITTFGSQKKARNIKRSFAPWHKNAHFLREDTNQLEQPPPKQEILAKFKKAIKAEGAFTRLPLNPEYQIGPCASELK
jgi:hypothetical protein